MQGKNFIDCATAAPILTFFPVNICLYITVFLYPATQKVVGYYVIPSEPFECPLVSSSVRALFPDSNFSSFWPIFFKLCMDIDIRQEWFGMAMSFFFVNFEQRYGPCLTSDYFHCPLTCELICGFRSNFVYALILTKCRLGMIEQYVLFTFNRVMALDWYRYFVYTQYLVDHLMDFGKFCY